MVGSGQFPKYDCVVRIERARVLLRLKLYGMKQGQATRSVVILGQFQANL